MSEQGTAGEIDRYLRLDDLRDGIRANRINFPSPVPIFACQHRVDIQWRVVDLYFLRGWSCTQIGERYNVTSNRIQQLLRRWVNRAKALGFLCEIPAEDAYATKVMRAWQEPPVVDFAVRVSPSAEVPPPVQAPVPVHSNVLVATK